jgi:hypothetical protein
MSIVGAAPWVPHLLDKPGDARTLQTPTMDSPPALDERSPSPRSHEIGVVVR